VRAWKINQNLYKFDGSRTKHQPGPRGRNEVKYPMKLWQNGRVDCCYFVSI